MIDPITMEDGSVLISNVVLLSCCRTPRGFYTESCLRNAVVQGKFNKKPISLTHSGTEPYERTPSDNPLDIVGIVNSTRHSDDLSIRAEIILFPTAQLPQMLALVRHASHLFGLSHDSTVLKDDQNNIIEIVDVASVDLVRNPGSNTDLYTIKESEMQEEVAEVAEAVEFDMQAAFQSVLSAISALSDKINALIEAMPSNTLPEVTESETETEPEPETEPEVAEPEAVKESSLSTLIHYLKRAVAVEQKAENKPTQSPFLTTFAGDIK